MKSQKRLKNQMTQKRLKKPKLKNLRKPKLRKLEKLQRKNLNRKLKNP